MPEDASEKKGGTLDEFGEVLTSTEAARVLRCARETLRGMADRGEVPYHRRGAHYVFFKRELAKYLAGEWKPEGE